MESISVLAWSFALIGWLGLGGWAFSDLAKDTEQDAIGPAIAFCILLAPFAAGIVIGLRK